MKMNLLAGWVAILAFLGLKNEDQEFEVTPDTMEKLNNELQSRADKLTQMQNDLNAATEAKTSAENAVNELTSKLSAADIKATQQEEVIAALKQVSKDPPAKVAASSDSAEKTDLNDFIAKNDDDTAACIAKMKEAGYNSIQNK